LIRIPADSLRMSTYSSLRGKTSIGLALILTLVSTSSAYGIYLYSVSRMIRAEQFQAQGFASAAQLTLSLQHEVLDAGVSFTYFARVQKPGSRDAGLQELNHASNTLAQLTGLTRSQAELKELREPAILLKNDMEDYRMSLFQTLEMLNQGVTSGDRYTAQMNTWAQSGAMLLDDADRLERLARKLRIGKDQAETRSMREALALGVGLSGGSMMLSLFLAYRVVRRLKLVHNSIVPSLAVSTVPRSDARARIMPAPVTTRREMSAAGNEKHGRPGHSTKTFTPSRQRVSEIVNAIDEIAFQTNLLALNVAEEAASQTGGARFAQFADEIRSLAERCGIAAKNTTYLIDDAVDRCEDSRRKMEVVASGMRTVTTEWLRIKALIDSMEPGNAERSRAIQQMGGAILRIDEAAFTGAILTERRASAAARLRSRAEAMNNVVIQLKVMVDGVQIGRGI